MKIYIGHAKKLDFKKELYQPIRESQLNALHEIILPHEIHEEASDFVTRDIIKTCDVVIAEVSFPATGLGIELGWADSASVSIICIYKNILIISIILFTNITLHNVYCAKLRM